MSSEHKQALALGREQGRIIKQYLEALEAHKPKRGRQRTAETVKRQLEEVAKRIVDADPFSRLQLVQDRIDLEHELAVKDVAVDLTAVEAEFVKVAADYGRRKGISYAAWRETGVDADVLKRAGITRAN